MIAWLVVLALVVGSGIMSKIILLLTYFMRLDCEAIKSFQKVSRSAGGFTANLASHNRFGTTVCDIGDANLDTIFDIGVGSPYVADGGNERGAVWLLFLRTDGLVKSFSKISNTVGAFTGISSVFCI
jgi:hypothetical protein